MQQNRAETDSLGILASLEPDQLTAAKRQQVPRRHLKGSEVLLLWSMRVYVLFMIVVIIYQVWSGA
ncbi:MAG TPA: hypothetical protein VKE71_02195 [Candidatus Angelobacter sp.]|nr:hypothetical protein [Candidatus Angelobacter sp.]